MDELSNVDRYIAFGSKIKQKRLSLGLTQEKVAESLNISVSFYSRIERGERVLSVDALIDIANFYSLSLDWLLLDAIQGSADEKFLKEIDNVFRDKSQPQATFLLNLLKVNAESIERLLP
jgi:transcriptional regulator with XRE-family HTH domain